LDDRKARNPRPFFAFLSGAICYGASVPFLLLCIAGARVFIMNVIQSGLFSTLTEWQDSYFVLMLILFVPSIGALVLAGQAFMSEKWRRGILSLLGFIITFLFMFGLTYLRFKQS
jgi:hypothetical protein